MYAIRSYYERAGQEGHDRGDLLGTWCPYCPGAAMGADDLIANGYNVAVVEYHNGDSYTNTASDARNNYYRITSYNVCYTKLLRYCTSS